MGLEPLHAPEAVHEVTFVALQVNVDDPPPATTEGLAERDTVGTFTDTDATAAELVPPAPAQVSENDELFVRAPVLWLPLTGNEPLHAPEAVHEVAFVELQVRFDVPFAATADGFAASVAVGTTFTVTDAALLVPPGPAQLSENDELLFSSPLLRVPLVGSVPFQEPEAVQELASVEFHVRVVSSPSLTIILDAPIDAVGTGLPGDEPPPQAVRTCAATSAANAINNRMSSPRFFAIVCQRASLCSRISPFARRYVMLIDTYRLPSLFGFHISTKKMCRASAAQAIGAR